MFFRCGRVLVKLLLLVTLGYSEGFSFLDGLTAYNNKDYEKAMKILKKDSNQEYAMAQYFIGGMYLFGQGVKPDIKKAISFFEKASDKGHIGSQYALGVIYEKEKDYKKAIEYFEKAADKGNIKSKESLNSLYKKYSKIKSTFEENKVPIIIGGDNSCIQGVVYRLKSNDFLAVRLGNSSKYEQIDSLYNEDNVWICNKKGKWRGIIYGENCNVDTNKLKVYDGQCKYGWSHVNWLKEVTKNTEIIKHNEDLLISPKKISRLSPDTYQNIPTKYGMSFFFYRGKFNNLYSSGQYQQALSVAKEELEMQKSVGFRTPFISICYNNIGLVYRSLGEYEQALEYLKKADFLEMSHPNTASIYGNIGLVYQDMGKHKKALEYSKIALNLWEDFFKKNYKQDIKLQIARVSNNLGLIYNDLGDSDKAIKYLKQALAIREDILGKEHPLTILSYNSMAVALLKKEPKKSYKFLGKASKASEHLDKKHPISLITNSNVAMFLHLAGQDKKALDKCKEVIEINEKKFGKEHPNTAMSYNYIAITYLEMKKYEESLRYFNKALSIYKKLVGEYHFETATSYNNIASVYLDMQNYTEAYNYIQKSFNIFKKNKNIIFTILDKNQKDSFIDLKKGYIYNFLTMSKFYKNSIKTKKEKNLISQQTLNHWLNYKRTIYDTQNALNLLYTKGDKKINAKIDQLHNAQRRLARLYQNVPQESKKLKNYNQQIKSTEEEISNLEIWLSKKSSNLYTQDISYQDIAKRLKEDELYIDFARVGDRYYYFTLDKDENIEFETFDENLSKEIDNKIALVRKEIRKGYNSIKRKGFTKLYDLIVRNIDLKNKKSLIISPDGVLGLVPFEAFYNAQTKEYLIEKFRVRYIPSGKELVKLYDNKSHSNNDIIVFADVDFPKKNKTKLKKERFTYLEFSKDEYKNIKRYFQQAKPRLGADATKINLLKVQSPKILHLSTHGFFDKNNSNPLMKSGIALSKTNQKSNGIVTGLELAGLNLRGTELVVLSACETGVGDIEEAEGVAGLSKSFMLAGAKYIVMSLWSVNDGATTELMRLFYENIKKGFGYSNALREAKRSMIKRGNKFAHPYYWSGFVGSGENSRSNN